MGRVQDSVPVSPKGSGLGSAGMEMEEELQGEPQTCNESHFMHLARNPATGASGLLSFGGFVCFPELHIML